MNLPQYGYAVINYYSVFILNSKRQAESFSVYGLEFVVTCL